MNKIYYLQTCDTCKRILNEMRSALQVEKLSNFTIQEIKAEPITVKQLEEMYSLTNSYEALFSKRAKKYKQMDLKNQSLTEKDYKQLILEEYTFLKRPVILFNNSIFVGNSKKEIARLIEAMQKSI